MSTKSVLRMTGNQHSALRAHLLPGDGLEAVAVALCGRHSTDDREVLSVYKILSIPYEECIERHALRVSWPTHLITQLIEEAARKNLAILKIHSHPGFFNQFSAVDDLSDSELFPSLHAWTDDGKPHASAVMLPDGSMFGRLALEDGSFAMLDRIVVVGDDVRVFDSSDAANAPNEDQIRTRQAFGDGTTNLLRKLRVAVVGCSGTGSWIVEQLARLGVGELVLVDPDVVEHKNLNRIVGTSGQDATAGKLKVKALAERITTYGTRTRVTTVDASLGSYRAIELVASCDILFGCMDSIEGRDILNRIAVFHCIPYFDLGVQLRADGKGGIDVICGSVHYLLPDGSSLLSRGVYSPKMLSDDSLRRTDPDRFQRELEEGYVRGAAVGAPAVISVNGFCATMAINEMLARLHPFRIDPNSDYRWQQFDIINSCWQAIPDTAPCPLLSKYAGRGQMTPLLNCSLIET